MNRDMVWHELFDRMQNDSCPICDLIHNRTKRSMDGFLYESVNDVTLRSKICKSNGFCNYHAYMLMGMGDPLAHALIYNDLLESAIDNIRTLNLKQKNLFQSHEECMFCEQAKEGERSYLGAFIDAFEDDEFKEKYINESCLCLPHLELIKNLKKQGKNYTNKIVDISLKKYQSLINNLLEIKRKSDYRFSHEPWTEQEKSAWEKAVVAINAKRGIKK